MNLTKLTRWSVVLAVAILVAGLSVDPPAAVGKQGKGGGGNPDQVPVIAVFENGPAVDPYQIVNNEHPIKQNELCCDASSHLMPGGDYVMQLRGKRGKDTNPELELYFDEDEFIPTGSPGIPPLIVASPSMTVHTKECMVSDCSKQASVDGGLRDLATSADRLR